MTSLTLVLVSPGVFSDSPASDAALPLYSPFWEDDGCEDDGARECGRSDVPASGSTELADVLLPPDLVLRKLASKSRSRSLSPAARPGVWVPMDE